MFCKLTLSLLVLFTKLSTASLSQNSSVRVGLFGNGNRSRLISLAAQQSDAAASDDFIFDLPDLVVTYTAGDSEVQLEAFKTKENDRILQNAETAKYNRLYWVSLGDIRLISKNTSSSQGIFRFTPESAYFYIDMLSEDEKVRLAAEANAKYGINAKPTQIKHLVLSELTCEIELFDASRERLARLVGKANNFRTFPVPVIFPLHAASNDRRVLEKRLKTGGDFHITCKAAKAAKVSAQSVLLISVDEMQRLDLSNRLFGGAQERFVTRSQMDALISEIYSSLEIYEEYDVGELSFGEELIKLLTSGLSQSHFAFFPILDALKNLSPFSITKDLQPDEIVKDLGSVFTVNETNGKQHIVANRGAYAKLNSHRLQAAETSDTLGVGTELLGKFNLNWSDSNKETTDVTRDWESKNDTLDDQLRELNTKTQSDIKWEVQGSKIVPKSLNVLKLTRSVLSKSLRFGRIRRVLSQAAFERSFTLSTANADELVDHQCESAISNTLAAQTVQLKLLQYGHAVQQAELQTLRNDQASQIAQVVEEIVELQGEIQVLQNGHAAQQAELQTLHSGHTAQQAEIQSLHNGHAAQQSAIQARVETDTSQQQAIVALQGRRNPECPLYHIWHRTLQYVSYTTNKADVDRCVSQGGCDDGGIVAYVACP